MDRTTEIADHFIHVGGGTGIVIGYLDLIAGFIPALALTRVWPEGGCDRFSAGRASDSSNPSPPHHGRCHILEGHSVMDIEASSMRTLGVPGL
jgi:hypothetical protein